MAVAYTSFLQLNDPVVIQYSLASWLQIDESGVSMSAMTSWLQIDESASGSGGVMRDLNLLWAVQSSLVPPRLRLKMTLRQTRRIK